MAAISATVVPEFCSIASTSLCRVARALESEVLEELLELLDPLESLDVLVVVLAVAVEAVADVEVDVELAVAACSWWCECTTAAT